MYQHFNNSGHSLHHLSINLLKRSFTNLIVLHCVHISIFPDVQSHDICQKKIAARWLETQQLYSELACLQVENRRQETHFRKLCFEERVTE